MADDDLPVEVDDLGRRLGYGLPLDGAVRWRLEQAIRDAAADVEAYLGRAITPVTYVQPGCYPYGTGWQLREYPVIEVLSAVAETDLEGQPTGQFTVTYRAGLDTAHDASLRPIARFVTLAAMYAPDVQNALPAGQRAVKSVAVEGQSVTFDSPAGSPGSGTPGSMPSVRSLDRWRLAGRRVFQRRGAPPVMRDWTDWTDDRRRWLPE